MSVRIQTAQNVDLEYEPASIGDRIVAQILDYLIYFGWLLIVLLIYRILNVGGEMSTFVVIGAVVLPILLYPVLTEYFLNGQTLGKRAMQIRVVLLDGGKPTLGAYLLRWLLSIVDLQLFSGLVAVITIAVNGKGQRVGDIAAGTSVIKITKKVTLAQVSYQSFPENYQLTYPEVAQLTDTDMETIRQVLRKPSEELRQLTADQVRNVLGINGQTDALSFLKTVLNDYAYLANKTAE